MDVMGIAMTATNMKQAQTQQVAAVSVLKMTLDSAAETTDALIGIMNKVTGVGVNLDVSG